MHRIFVAILSLACVVTAAPATACIAAHSYEEAIARWSRSPEQIDDIIERSEIIVDGVISEYDSGSPRPKAIGGTVAAKLRVSRVWKGEIGAEVPIYISMYLIGCTLPPEYGLPVRLAGSFDEGLLFYGTVGGLPLGNALLDQKLREYELKKPILDAERAREIELLKAKTEALRQAAATGDVQARLNFAAHLLAHNQESRAHEIADALRRDGVKLAPFGAFNLTGERKDWSDLKRIHDACTSDHADLDGAVMDRADLAGCAFRYSSFRDASFRGTNLTGSYFQDSDLTGAKFDCATKLPDDLDPKAAGMINVEGQCPAN